MKESGYVYKLGDGPIDFNWNRRYIAINGINNNNINNRTNTRINVLYGG